MKKIFKLMLFILIMFLGIEVLISVFYPIAYKDVINKYSDEYNVDPFLVASIINVESNYNKEAVSIKDARGLMQIGPQTGKWAAEVLSIQNYSNESLFEPEVNIRIGTWYLNQLNKEFNNNPDLVLAAYNAGSGNVSKWLVDKKYSKDGKNLSNIPFKETAEYLVKVNSNHKIYSTVYKNNMEKPDSRNSLYENAIIILRDFIRKTIRTLRQGGYFEV